MPELDVPLLKVAHLILRKTIAILILFTSTETRLNHDLSLMVVINGTHATADISVKVMSLACWNMNIHKYMFIIIIPRKDIVHRLPYMVT